MASLATSRLSMFWIGGKVALGDKLRRDEITVGLPTIQRDHVHIILHCIGPVAHQVLVHIICIDQLKNTPRQRKVIQLPERIY